MLFYKIAPPLKLITLWETVGLACFQNSLFRMAANKKKKNRDLKQWRRRRQGRHLVKNIEDITCPRVDMNFIFEWSTRYLTSERSERVRYRVDHEKIKFIFISGHVIFCLLYKHQWNTKPFYFNIFNGLKVERVVTKHGRSTWTKTKFIW